MLNRFHMNIDTGNDAFRCEDGADLIETARILQTIAGMLEIGRRKGPVHDMNGNRVGSWELEREDD